jgi:hypothetical protein
LRTLSRLDRGAGTGGSPRPDAQHLAEDLQRRFGKHQVFFDSRTIAPGTRWPNEIRAALEAATVVVACFGPEWHRQIDLETGVNRLDEPADWVREELAAAGRRAATSPAAGADHAHRHHVLPVLLAPRSEMPKAAIDCRSDLVYLNSLQAIPLRTGSERDAGVAALVAAIVERGVPELPAEQRAPVAPQDLLVRYRDAMVAMHSKLVPFHPDLQERLLADHKRVKAHRRPGPGWSSDRSRLEVIPFARPLTGCTRAAG